MPNGTVVPTKIWIFRKGNGQLRVHPSPVLLEGGTAFRIRNLTNEEAVVTFPGREIDKDARIAPKGLSDPLVAVAPSTYFEYDVLVGGHYADGGSKPGGIIDP
jgi:hypothetical protein